MSRYDGGAMMGPERSTGAKSRPAAYGIHVPNDDPFDQVDEWNELGGQPPVAQPTRQWWPPNGEKPQ
ncbi:hypothetical protein [Micromonospora inositola]|uniref:Uncharacterized protein n=1 Tax=Micromonospora inositola TaxID=47865 RepID=A0A1C5JTU7_9ACTN|nr:hypothetical protein [Micromonospora inositola]SCG73928.1 hypothetical protein GA0070613_5419 [Micromonospora inositola]